MVYRAWQQFLFVSVVIIGLGLSPVFAQTPPVATTTAAALPSFADMVDTLMPSVVNISTTQEIDIKQPDFAFPQFPPGSPFEELFRDFFERGFPQGFGEGAPDGGGRGGAPAERDITSLGSGFVISADGLIVTNNHVVAQADEITVILHDNTELHADVVGKDPKTDLAVLRVKSPKPLKPVVWGDSDKTRVGDWVMAIGNPFGLGGTVTAGIISARARDINAGPYDDFMQTDASINRGNSGGPMFNTRGELIGINTAIFSPSGGSIGIGFAIPSTLARPVIDQLIQLGRTKRGWLGVRIQEVTDDLAQNMGLGKPRGALVAGVTPGGPADKAGFQAGDVIITYNGHDIGEMRELPRAVANSPVGDKVKVVVIRKGEQKSFDVKLGELEQAEEQMSAQNGGATDDGTAEGSAANDKNKPQVLGMTLAPLTDTLRHRFELEPAVRGVAVIAVDRTADAARKAIRVGDVIAQVDYENVATPDDVMRQIKAARKKNRPSVLLRLVGSDDAARFVVISLAEPKTPPKKPDGVDTDKK